MTSSNRTDVPAAVKRKLIAEAGDKCANPGCANRLVDLHHIREWSVYKTHDGAHMIAICPACHVAVHRGSHRIPDETLYQWKGIRRDASRRSGFLYVEPAADIVVQFGCFRATRLNPETVFDFPNGTVAMFDVFPGGILEMNLALVDTGGSRLIEIRKNHVLHSVNSGTEVRDYPGRVTMFAPADTTILPQPMLEWIAAYSQPLIAGGRIRLLDVEVIAPGHVKVGGFFNDGQTLLVSGYNCVLLGNPRTNGLATIVTENPDGPPSDILSDVQLPIFNWIVEAANARLSK